MSKRKKKPGRKPFGYYTDEAAVVDVIKNKRRQRKGQPGPTPWNRIAAEMNDFGYKTQLEKKWTAQTVKNTWLNAQKVPVKKKKKIGKTTLGPGDFLDEAEVVRAREILKNAGEVHLLMLFDFMVGSGLRASEAIGIRIRDISIGEKKYWINVRATIAKGKRPRVIVIPKGLVDRISGYIKRVGRENMDTFLAGPGGDPLNYRGLCDRVKKIGKMIEIPSLHPHALRHTFALTLYNYIPAPNRLEILQQQLGHKDLKTTLIYLRTSKMIQSEEFEGFGELFDV